MAPASIPSTRIKTRQIKWLWEPYVPMGMLTLIAGVPGEGKSLLTCWLAAEQSKKHHVIMSNSEDTYEFIVKPRLERLGANFANITFMDPPPVLPRDTEFLIKEIDRLKASLVVLDPVQDHLSVSMFSPKVTEYLSPFSRTLAHRSCALVLVSHTIKTITKGQHPLYAVGGASGGLARVARIVHLFGRHPSDSNKRVLAPAKANFLSEQDKVAAVFDVENEEREPNQKRIIRPGKLNFEGSDNIKASQLIGQGETNSVPHGDKKLEAAQWLQERIQIGGGAVPVKVLQQDALEAGIAWPTIRRADDEIIHTLKERIGIKGKRGGGQLVWSITNPPD